MTDRPTALLYNPAVVTYGGGERYTFALADALAEDYDVVIGTKALPDPGQLERRGFPTGYEIRSIPPRALTEATRGVDLTVQLRLSPPVHPSRARRSVAVVQFPSKPLASVRAPHAYLRQRRAMATFDTYITYSRYCADWVRSRWGISSEVVCPPAELGRHIEPKAAGILSIARFDPTKQHPVLIEAYKSLPAALRAFCPLHLVGGRSGEDEGYVRHLLRLGRGENIRYHFDASQADVQRFLMTNSLFWHAKGFGRPADRPELAEHFGIAVVEAMSHGLVPLVVRDGGLPEVVDSSCGVTWGSVDELVSATRRLLTDDDHRRSLADRAAARSLLFSRDLFTERVRSLLVGAPDRRITDFQVEGFAAPRAWTR